MDTATPEACAISVCPARPKPRRANTSSAVSNSCALRSSGANRLRRGLSRRSVSASCPKEMFFVGRRATALGTRHAGRTRHVVPAPWTATPTAGTVTKETPPQDRHGHDESQRACPPHQPVRECSAQHGMSVAATDRPGLEFTVIRRRRIPGTSCNLRGMLILLENLS